MLCCGSRPGDVLMAICMGKSSFRWNLPKLIFLVVFGHILVYKPKPLKNWLTPCTLSQIRIAANRPAHNSIRQELELGTALATNNWVFVATVSAGRDPDRCAVTLRWQDPGAATSLEWQDPEAATPLEWQDPEAVIAAGMAGPRGRYCR